MKSFLASLLAAALLAFGPGVALGDGVVHAPWPGNWNNWNDAALWVTVGDPGNPPDTRYSTPGYGAVAAPFRIGKFEITAGQYKDFLNAVAGSDPYDLYNPSMTSSTPGCRIYRGGPPGGYFYTVSSDFANRPVNYISWGDAVRFANWLHNGKPTIGAEDLTTTEDGAYYLNGARSDADLMAVTRKPAAKYWIPTEDHWYKAAYYDPSKPGIPYWIYPTKSENFPPPSNIVIDPDPGNNANFYDAFGTGNGDYSIGSPYYRTVAGEFEKSASHYGTFDQGGNVREWTETADGSGRVLRGGSWWHNLGYLAAGVRESLPPTSENYSIGFRVATNVPEPSTFALLAVGAVSLLAYAWRRRKRAGS